MTLAAIAAVVGAATEGLIRVLDGGEALNGARVLLLEDEFLIAMDVEQLCRDHGAEDVVIVRNLAETENEGFEPASFDVAIVDVMLGGHSALGFAARLRENQVPFVFASGYLGLDEVFAAFPGVGVLNKPYAGDALVSAVAAAIGARDSGGL